MSFFSAFHKIDWCCLSVAEKFRRAVGWKPVTTLIFLVYIQVALEGNFLSNDIIFALNNNENHSGCCSLYQHSCQHWLETPGGKGKEQVREGKGLTADSAASVCFSPHPHLDFTSHRMSSPLAQLWRPASSILQSIDSAIPISQSPRILYLLCPLASQGRMARRSHSLMEPGVSCFLFSDSLLINFFPD